MWALPAIRWKKADKQNVDQLDFSTKAQKWQVQAGLEYFAAVYWHIHAPGIDYDIWKPNFENLQQKTVKFWAPLTLKQPPVTVLRIPENFKLYHTYCSALLIACPCVIKISRDMVTNKWPTFYGCLSGKCFRSLHTHRE